MPCRRGRHLRLLHMALPALVAGAVEAGLVAKEALSRRRRGGTPAGFTDDGFPLGVAFLLKVVVLRQSAPTRGHGASISYSKSGTGYVAVNSLDGRTQPGFTHSG